MSKQKEQKLRKLKRMRIGSYIVGFVLTGLAFLILGAVLPSSMLGGISINKITTAYETCVKSSQC